MTTLSEIFENPEKDNFTYVTLKAEILKDYHRRMIRDLNKQESLRVDMTQAQLMHSKQTPVNCFTQANSGRFIRKRNLNREGMFVTKYIPESYENITIPATHDWTLDSASTSHVCQNKEFFIELKSLIKGSVIKMRSTPHEVKVIGTVQFTIKDGPKKNNCIREYSICTYGLSKSYEHVQNG